MNVQPPPENTPRRKLTEADIESTVNEFVRACAEAFNNLGFRIGVEGGFNLKLTDDGSLDETKRRSHYGLIRYKGPEFAKTKWAFSDDPGVYIFFDAAGSAHYVGKAETAIGSRVGAHIGAHGPDRSYPASAFPGADHVIVVPFIAAPFLAPALESYLLRRYEFDGNLALNRKGK